MAQRTRNGPKALGYSFVMVLSRIAIPFGRSKGGARLLLVGHVDHRGLNNAASGAGMDWGPPANDGPVEIAAPSATLAGILGLPEHARGVILFAHGSGSGRLSPRNQAVAQTLQSAGLGTLLFDLLTEDEARDRRNVFDIDLLSDRLVEATDWLVQSPDVPSLPVGYFGASTGAAAALEAATKSSTPISAIVSRGGRPDLAGPHLQSVESPTLLIVGGKDEQVIALNEAALADLPCEKKLVVIPGATHLFEEPGALEGVADLARSWFLRHLQSKK